MENSRLTIHIQPSEAWGYFEKNKERLTEQMVEIGENGSNHTSVYITENNGKPYLYVYVQDRKVFQSACNSPYETERNLRIIYTTYLKLAAEEEDEDDDGNAKSELDEMTEAEFELYVEERENTIVAAVKDLIDILTEDSSGDIESDADVDMNKITDHIVRYLAEDCGFRIRRPMTLIDDETGKEVRTEYPYEEYDFSDEKEDK